MLYFCDHITNFSEFEDKIITNKNFFIFEFHLTRHFFIDLSTSSHYTSLKQVCVISFNSTMLSGIRKFCKYPHHPIYNISLAIQAQAFFIHSPG